MKTIEQLNWEEGFYKNKWWYMKFEPSITTGLEKCNFCKTKTTVAIIGGHTKYLPFSYTKVFNLCKDCLDEIYNKAKAKFTDYSKIQFKSVVEE